VTNLISYSTLEEKISSIVTPSIEGLGFELVRVRLIKGEPSILQIMADRKDCEIDVDDCSLLSRDISTLLDVEDPIAEAYVLEVSSPGIDRPLTRLKDFIRWRGYEVKLETAKMINDQRRFKGEISEVEGNTIILNVQNTRIRINFKLLADAKLVLTDNLIRDVLRKRKKLDKFDLNKFDKIEETIPDEGEN
jgi:ribosome maturation factor RimP